MGTMKILFAMMITIISIDNVIAQSDKSERAAGLKTDSSVTFKVLGACSQCKNRIEDVVKGRGVKMVNWNIESKMLNLTYDPTQISLDKIQNRIVGAGHDLENKKAKDAVYNELPSCCHYRE